MILAQEISKIASNLNLLSTTVEKDYVLSWVLYGISKNPQLSKWLFKGGTCLKKCYFETYRFSEDLDFTIPEGEVYTKDSIKNALNEVANIVYEETGINLKRLGVEVEESINKRNNKTFIAKLTYLGPLNLPSRNSQRVKFDITNDEIVVDASDIREVFHPYSDAPNPGTKIRCYSINEILTEKTRAIYERQGRARDIYDIVNISRNFREDVNKDIARSGIEKKFNFIGITNPSVDLILSQLDFSQLESSWTNQLKHQIEVLPSAENFFHDLKPALSWWFDEHSVEQINTPISMDPNETTLPRAHFPERLHNQITGLGRGHNAIPVFFKYLDQIRYAARNRLCLEIEYEGIKRIVEPYSIKELKNGNLLLYVYALTKGDISTRAIRSYYIDTITDVKVTEQSFIPRYLVEI